MNSIELTEEHKVKLLEMCSKLFKEESEINSIQNFRISNDYVLGLSNHTLYCENRDISDNQYDGEEVPEDELLDFYTYPINCFEINMHWFEFCTKLAHKIFSKKQYYYQSDEFITFMKIMCLQDKTKLQHPINYLYEIFKQLK